MKDEKVAARLNLVIANSQHLAILPGVRELWYVAAALVRKEKGSSLF